MVERKIELTCPGCARIFQKALKEYNRQLRNGRKEDRFFCSDSCSSKYYHEQGLWDNEAAYERMRASGKRGIRKRTDTSPFKWFVRRAKIRAKRNSRKECSITAEYLKELFDSQNGQCPFTNWEMNLPNCSRSEWNDKFNYRNASLDRIDNSKGYIKGNVRFVCLIANMARQTFSDEQVVEFCKAVAEAA